MGISTHLFIPWWFCTTWHYIYEDFADVQMDHARPFWAYTLQELSNGINNTSMRGVLTPAIVF